MFRRWCEWGIRLYEASIHTKAKGQYFNVNMSFLFLIKDMDTQ